MISKDLVDYLAMDYKTTFADYEKVVKAKIKNTSKVSADFTLEVDRGKDNLIGNIKSSMKLILSSGLPFEFRTTVPGIHDKKTLVEMAKQLRSIVIRNTQYEIRDIKWFLQQFQPKTCLDPEFEKIKPYSKMEMEEFLKTVKKVILKTELRGN